MKRLHVDESKALPMNLLHLDSSILGPDSVSRAVSAASVEQLKKTYPELQVTYRDLASNPIPHLSGAYFEAVQAGLMIARDPVLQEDLALGTRILAEFLAADIVVIGAAFYNFGIPSQLKAWIDRVVVTGKTVRYTANGPEGLAGDKRVIITLSRGGFYAPVTPKGSFFEHAETHLRAVLAFIGIAHPEFIVAEGVSISQYREAAIKGALERAAALQGM